MKRIAGCFLAFLILSACLSAAAEAGPAAGEEQAVRTYGNYQYRLLEDGTAEVLIYVGNRTELTIPADMDGVEVTSIGESAFLYCTFTDAVVPKGVTVIGVDAFCFCASLTSVILPDTVTEIRSGAFYGCTRLKSLSIPYGVKVIERETFSGCDSLGGVFIPDSVVLIDYAAFSGCRSLTDIALPAGVAEIGEAAFMNCAELRELAVPEGVTEIRSKTFFGCKSLSRLTIPSSVTEIRADHRRDGRQLRPAVLRGKRHPLRARPISGLTGIGPYLYRIKTSPAIEQAGGL